MILALWLACTGDGAESAVDSVGAGLETGTTDSVDTDTQITADECDAEPTVTWANFGQGFMLGYCQPCHASTAPDRHGAPVDVVFDTEADCITRAERIAARASGDAPTMPPGGGVPQADRALLEIWLSCGL
jgi:uncharacterized membrane protein